MKLLFALAVTNEDSAAAEKLLDFLRTFSGKSGHLLLALQSDVHEEMKSRIRISAELAFDVVHAMTVNPLSDPVASPMTKANSQFRQVATHVANSFRWPFLWLTPQCTPTTSAWREKLNAAYEAQPHAFFGTRMMSKTPGPEPKEFFFMAKVGVYPANTVEVLIASPSSFAPIEMECSRLILPKMGHTKLIQQANILTEGDLISVRDDAVLVTGDRSGFLRAQVKTSVVATMGTSDGFRAEPEPVKVHIEQLPDPLVSRLAKGIKNGKATRR